MTKHGFYHNTKEKIMDPEKLLSNIKSIIILLE